MVDDASGAPPHEVVHALFRHEALEPGHFSWTQVRELSEDEWLEARESHVVIAHMLESFDKFLPIAWQDLQVGRDEVLERLHTDLSPEGIAPQIEYRILNFSTGLKLYHEHVLAELNRNGTASVKTEVNRRFSELYDNCRGYRFMYSLRNAFLHGTRGLVRIEAGVRLVDEAMTEKESWIRTNIQRKQFDGSKANAAVRREIREMADDPEIYDLCTEALEGVQQLHAGLIPLLHPRAPRAAHVIRLYALEVGRSVPYFHEYRRDDPRNPTITNLSRTGFEYMVTETGGQITQ